MVANTLALRHAVAIVALAGCCAANDAAAQSCKGPPRKITVGATSEVQELPAE